MLKHNYIGTEHILLGLLREQEGLAARALDSLDITIERVRQQVVRIVGAGEDATSGQIPFTPRAKKVLELAIREAMSFGHSQIGTEHILLGLGRENEGVAVRILLDLDVNAETIRNEVVRMLSGAGGEWQPEPRGSRAGRRLPVSDSWLGGTRPTIGELDGRLRRELERSPDSGDLLLVLACADGTRAAAALRALGVDLDALTAAVAAAREQVPVSQDGLTTELEEVRDDKRAAAAAEEFERASELRDQARELIRTLADITPGPELIVELERRLGLARPE